MIYTSEYFNRDLGTITLAADDDKLMGLWLPGQKHFCSGIKSITAVKKYNSTLNQSAEWLDRYFGGDKPSPCELALAPIGSDFQKSVWELLCKIPYGETITYGNLAKEIASLRGISTMSAQAVGNAVGHNPISIIIPCHRVIGSDGNLTGYAGGIDKKIYLLKHEKIDIERLKDPRK